MRRKTFGVIVGLGMSLSAVAAAADPVYSYVTLAAPSIERISYRADLSYADANGVRNGAVVLANGSLGTVQIGGVQQRGVIGVRIPNSGDSNRQCLDAIHRAFQNPSPREKQTLHLQIEGMAVVAGTTVEFRGSGLSICDAYFE